jgi:hypothetical protein
MGPIRVRIICGEVEEEKENIKPAVIDSVDVQNADTLRHK